MTKKVHSFPTGPDMAYDRIINWFFSFPNSEVGLNELASNLKLSKISTKKVISRLVGEGFLIHHTYGKKWRITCNKNHLYNLSRKIVFNLANVYEIYEFGLREDIHKIIRNPRAVILFGSYRKGDDTEKSDIDIAIETLDDDQLKIVELGKTDIGYRKNIQINLHIFSRKKIDLNLFSNIANGIVLEGFLEVRP